MADFKLFEVGQIIRYRKDSAAISALMKVETVSIGHGGQIARYYGEQYFGSTVGAYHEDCEPASEKDLAQWKAAHPGG